MPEYKLQRFRGGWAIALYEDGKRISRHQLKSSDAPGAAAEFNRIVADAERPVDPDVRTIWEAYREDRGERRIARNMKGTAKHILAFFGDKKPDDVTIKLCRSYAAKRRTDLRGSDADQERWRNAGKPVAQWTGVSNGTIRTELNHLRIALLWAEKHRLIERAPAIEMPSSSPPRERYLLRSEFDRLLAAVEMPHMRLYLLLAISTAGRNAALLELTWDRIDLERGLVYLGAAHVLRPQKGRATVPMTKGLRTALIGAQAERRTDHVIEWAGKPVASVRTSLEKAAARAKVKGVSPHVLRHTAAVWMAEDGVKMSEIAAILGHSDDRITQRVYAKFSPDHLRQAVNSLEILSRPHLTVVT